jgi:signal transduction histidine kinase
LTQVDHIVGTFDALLRLAKIENTARQEAFTEINLGTLAEQLVTVFGPVIEDSGHRITLTLRDPQTVRADADLLLQLGANLIQNALRYGAEGQTIAIAVQGRQFTISDQGPGIPLDERKKVLEPLYRLSDTRQSDGFGLGLSLVRAICDLHEADLTLSDAADGPGQRVGVRFPQPEPQITKL